ncbi:23999_t:CDS:2, partial [Gigaspora rosea]
VNLQHQQTHFSEETSAITAPKQQFKAKLWLQDEIDPPNGNNTTYAIMKQHETPNPNPNNSVRQHKETYQNVTTPPIQWNNRKKSIKTNTKRKRQKLSTVKPS